MPRYEIEWLICKLVLIMIIPITTNMVDYSITAVDCLEFESLYIC